ncbi:MAG TPA: 50S ribosomal protein L15 [Candidatus Dormibacteraeota bacterium]
MRLDELKPAAGSRRSRKRVGRGISAGGGKTAGRGQKGQGSRSSWSLPRGFEGGQMPLTQRVPKLRGFYNRFRVEFQVVNCGKLARFDAGSVVDSERLRQAGLIRSLKQPVKLLAGGGAPPALTIRVDRASRAAQEAIKAAGGSVELSQGPAPAPEESIPAASAKRRRAGTPATPAEDDVVPEEPEGAGESAAEEPAGGGQESST